MRGSMDGQVVYQGSTEWELHDEQDDDGRWYFWSTCCRCGGVEHGDAGRDNHECAMVDAECDSCGGEGLLFDGRNSTGRREERTCPTCVGRGTVEVAA